jgi:hypothetical protein
MTGFRVRILLLCFASGAVLGQSFTAHAGEIDYFPNLCTDLRHGMALADVETLLLARGYSGWDAGAFTGRMVLEHCPDVKASVVGQAREALR